MTNYVYVLTVSTILLFLLFSTNQISLNLFLAIYAPLSIGLFIGCVIKSRYTLRTKSS